ncbi:MAG: fumarate hydratase [Actinobacteria bacterium RBG_16_64_13]|nr:MAG: fumarate hydratase [Actinobacteria bacterium RBG_16_64_13]
MRELDVARVADAVAKLAIDACNYLGDDIVAFFEKAIDREQSDTGRDVLAQLLENANLAKDTHRPLCQDTGLAVVFLEVGQDVHLVGGSLEDAVNAGVSKGYTEGYLRKSAVADPIGARKNTGDNTPAMLHTRIVPGDKVRIIVATKGGGAENMSALGMLKPSQGRQGAVDFIVDTVSKAGPNPCPPIIVGVGLGGTFEKAAYMAKHALLREVGSTNPEPRLAELEDELEKRCNDLGIGPAGLGGTVSVIDVFIEELPAHIASMPVAVNIQCHSARHKEVVL